MVDEDNEVKSFFQDSIDGDNLGAIVNAAKRLPSIAAHIGVDKTKEKLLPHIKYMINENMHDEVLATISEQLECFLPLVGGMKNIELLLEVFEVLCATDETLVRHNSVKAIRTLTEGLTEDLAEKYLLPFIEKLADRDWLSCKCAAGDLISVCYPKVKEEKKTELKNLCKVLIADECPLVRKSVAASTLEFLGILETECILPEFMSVFDQLLKDPMDSVRVVAVDFALEMAKKLTEAEIKIFLFEKITSLFADSSWRIRQRTAYKIPEFQTVICQEQFRQPFISLYIELIKDSETEIRVIAAENLYKYCFSLNESFKRFPDEENKFEIVFENNLINLIELVIGDQSEAVRIAASTNMLLFGQLLSGACFKATILPIVVAALQHEESVPFQENILTNLNYLPDDIDLTQSLKSVSFVVQSLLSKSKLYWRTRRSILLALTHLMKYSSKEYFNENLKVCYTHLINDNIYAIRRTSPLILPFIAKRYGIKWTYENIIPIYLSKVTDYKYLRRCIPLLCINEIIDPTVENDGNRTYTSKYLSSLKEFIFSSNEDLHEKAVKILGTTVTILESLKNKFQDKIFQDTITKNEDHGSNDGISFYAEDTLAIMKQNKIEVYKMTENEVTECNCTYLEGVLFLIYNEFFDIIKLLAQDKTPTVRNWARISLLKIKTFLIDLNNEVQQEWVQQVLGKPMILDLQEKIEKRVNSNLGIKVPVIAEEDKIDTTLSDYVDNEVQLPDLGNDIPELQISITDTANNIQECTSKVLLNSDVILMESDYLKANHNQAKYNDNHTVVCNATYAALGEINEISESSLSDKPINDSVEPKDIYISGSFQTEVSSDDVKNTALDTEKSQPKEISNEPYEISSSATSTDERVLKEEIAEAEDGQQSMESELVAILDKKLSRN